MSKKPFFIGWEETPATDPVQKSKRWSMLALVFGLTAIAIGAALQQGFRAEGKWDFTEKSFTGVLIADPYPTVVTDSGVYYLVLPTKHAVRGEDVAAMHLNSVEIIGSVIEDPNQPVAMIAVKSADAITSTGVTSANPLQLASSAKPVTLRGEIIDSKCAFGAMNPATLKPHRACAIACLTGGIPPVLLVRHDGGTRATHYLLVDDQGRSLTETAVKFAALPIEVSGTVSSIGDWHILRAAPESIALLD
ncbi:MAG: hypothetical protein SynsKO_01110 [Synoicihabitans sp.]